MKKQVNWNKVISIVCMVIGILTLAYFLYVTFVAIEYIASLVKAGQISAGKEFGKILQYIMTQSFSYLFYGVGFMFMGRMLLVNHKQDTKIDFEVSKEALTQETSETN
ncbi:hypothetical protein [Amedibacillus sp. YH-ame10]